MFRKDDIRIILIAVLGLLLILPIVEAAEISCKKHPIFCQIKDNVSKARKRDGTFRKIKPIMSDAEIMKLSNIIYKASRKFDIPANIYTAILRQESTYRLGAKNCRLGVDENWNEVRTCADFGMSMVNIRTAKSFKFDLQKLSTDLEYSVYCGAEVLADFKKRYFHKEEYWWTRYNASTPYKRRFYQGLVEDFL